MTSTQCARACAIRDGWRAVFSADIISTYARRDTRVSREMTTCAFRAPNNVSAVRETTTYIAPEAP